MAASASAGSSSLPPMYRHGNSDILPAWSRREAAAAEQPWTATRCHRQLRPLLSHLAALRREKAMAALQASRSTASQAPSGHKHPHSDDDQVSRKRVRYTYSLKGTGRRRRGRPGSDIAADRQPAGGCRNPERTKAAPFKQPAGRSVLPGEVVMATPVLSRAQKHRHALSLPSSPITQHTAAAASAVGRGAFVPVGAEDGRSKSAAPLFKYRGYYHGPPRQGGSNDARSPIDEEWETLSRTSPPAFRPLYESIFRAVDALLRATTVCASDASANTSGSLLAMCLRKVPQYVAVCEAAEREEAQKSGTAQSTASSVSLEIYSDLESLGTGGRGWKHLRTVVRAHGIGILKMACAEGLLHEAFVRLLIRLCASMRAYPEAEDLMATLFGIHVSALPKDQHLYGKPDGAAGDLSESAGPMASLSMLLQYADETGRTSAPLQQVTELLSSGHLPAAWLSARPFESLWLRVVRLLSSRGPPVCDEHALFDFAATAVTRLVQSRPTDDLCCSRPGVGHVDSIDPCNRPAASLSSSSSYHTLVSILGSICAVGILQQESALEHGNAGDDVPEPLVFRRLSAIIHRSLLETRQSVASRKQHGAPSGATTTVSPRRYLLTLALHLSTLCRGEEGVRQHNVRTCDESLHADVVATAGPKQKEQLYTATVSFVTCVAENCGRGARSASLSIPAARGYLLRICSHVADRTHELFDCGSQESLFGRLQTDSAFLLASRSNDLRDLAFAECLRRGQTRQGKRLSPCVSQARDMDVPESMPTEVAVAAQPVQIRRASLPAGLFEGYRWEEGISEWVVSTLPSRAPPPLLRSSKPRTRRDSDSGADGHCLGASTPERRASSQRPSLRPGRPLLSTSYLTPSPSSRATPNTLDVSGRDENRNEAAPPPRMPRSRAGAARVGKRLSLHSLPSSSPPSSDSDWEAGPSSRKRPRRPSLPSQEKRASRERTLLDLVSDNDDETDSYDEHDHAEGGLCGREEGAGARRRPLRTRAGNATRLVGAWPPQQGKAAAAGDGDNGLSSATSDDELCL